jgi:hypothetical protein
MSLLDHPFLAPAGESSRHLKRALALTATLALVTLAILLPVMQSSDETTQGYRIRVLEQQRSDVEAQIYQTQAQIAQLGALSRIDSEAHNHIGMIPVQRETAVTVSVPAPTARLLPNSYLPPEQASDATVHANIWQRLRHLLPFA